MNQADEVESIGHGRELAADSIPGKKESAIEHGDENAIEAPRNYNEFSVNGNNPLNSVSQSRGAPQIATPTAFAQPPVAPAPPQDEFPDDIWDANGRTKDTPAGRAWAASRGEEIIKPSSINP